ncbi:hypothetical protein LSTR_LSTR002622 [Laodelphax striatellus]|uniref:Gem-associated protein 2 n=1 Tax=Laodelphax striatellus TaxID=195883 RepID=A0A482XN21_LAOST|nr:hypothetical protein LSTR_LSTR002622 [Laodelphax striatellus]
MGDDIMEVFFTQPLPKNYRPSNSPPMDGIEYLRRVQYESRSYPVVCVAPPDKQFRSIRIDDCAGPSYLPPNQKVASCDKSFLPTIDWQNQQVADFSDVRHIIAIRRECEKEEGRCIYDGKVLPEKYSEEAWFKICVRDPNAPEPTPSDGIKQKTYLEPSVSVLLELSQDFLSSLLEFFVEWITKKKTSVLCLGKWIYSILACLEIPLLPEMCASLRELSRLAAVERAQLQVDKNNNAKKLNLIICLVGRYFNQLDLADPA